MRNGTSWKLLPVVKLTRSQNTTLPEGKLDGAKIAPYAKMMTPVLDTSWLAAAGPVGETTVVVVLPHVTVKTKPVWVSAEATPAPITSTAVTTTNAAAEARFTVRGKARRPCRGPVALMTSPVV
jgi:type II secretory pathway component PulK